MRDCGGRACEGPIKNTGGVVGMAHALEPASTMHGDVMPGSTELRERIMDDYAGHIDFMEGVMVEIVKSLAGKKMKRLEARSE